MVLGGLLLISISTVGFRVFIILFAFFSWRGSQLLGRIARYGCRILLEALILIVFRVALLRLDRLGIRHIYGLSIGLSNGFINGLSNG